jgi:hypothetical protein
VAEKSNTEYPVTVDWLVDRNQRSDKTAGTEISSSGNRIRSYGCTCGRYAKSAASQSVRLAIFTYFYTFSAIGKFPCSILLFLYVTARWKW